MDVIVFTEQELNQLTVAQMKVLVEYYDLKVSGRKRQDYLDALMQFYKIVDSYDFEIVDGQVQEVPAMSVRIRRIKEQNNVTI